MKVEINGKVVYEPTAKQLLFHKSTARFPLYGGAAGGGKSHALRWHAYLSCLQVPGFKALLLRRNLPDLKRHHEKVAALESHTLGSTFLSSEHLMKFLNGSTLEFGHCADDESVAIYLSAEYDLVLFDELVTFTEYQYLMISSRCRTTIPGVLPKVMCATNPGGPQSQWVRRRWIDKDVDEFDDPSYKAEEYEYIPATLRDNPYINQDEYELQLNRLPGELARAYRDGDWDIFMGQYFQEFRRDLHVKDMGEVPATYRRILGLDWGYAQEGVCLWGVVLPNGQLYIEDELVFNGSRRNKLIAPQVAKAIVERNEERGIAVRAIYADPAMFAPLGHTGETMAETFQRNGLFIQEADNDRLNGWARVRAWLAMMPPDANFPDQRVPHMVINPKCGYLIRTLPQLVMDERQPEDVDTKSADHAADALRYLVMGRPAPTRQAEVAEFPIGTVGYYRQQILQHHQRQRLGHRQVRRRYAY